MEDSLSFGVDLFVTLCGVVATVVCQKLCVHRTQKPPLIVATLASDRTAFNWLHSAFTACLLEHCGRRSGYVLGMVNSTSTSGIADGVKHYHCLFDMLPNVSIQLDVDRSRVILWHL